MKLLLLSLLSVYASAFGVVKPGVVRSSVNHLNVASLEPPAVASPFLSNNDPQALVSDFLDGLMHDDDTTHRMKLLLHSSTHKWRSKIYDAIGAPASADETKVATALGAAMRNPNNQFAILLGMAEDFEYTFPSDVVVDEGKCWVECRLYNKKDGELLVVSGWDLQQSPTTGAWLFDRIDWQDFRDAFYPGLGREEWCRAFV